MEFHRLDVLELEHHGKEAVRERLGIASRARQRVGAREMGACVGQERCAARGGRSPAPHSGPVYGPRRVRQMREQGHQHQDEHHPKHAHGERVRGTQAGQPLEQGTPPMAQPVQRVALLGPVVFRAPKDLAQCARERIGRARLRPYQGCRDQEGPSCWPRIWRSNPSRRTRRS